MKRKTDRQKVEARLPTSYKIAGFRRELTILSFIKLLRKERAKARRELVSIHKAHKIAIHESHKPNLPE